MRHLGGVYIPVKHTKHVMRLWAGETGSSTCICFPDNDLNNIEFPFIHTPSISAQPALIRWIML